MTELQKLYEALRSSGRGHSSAIAALTRQIRVDQETVQRTLGKADKQDARDRREAA